MVAKLKRAGGDSRAKAFRGFEKNFPGVAASWEALGEAVHGAGPLTPRERRLVKLALAVGGRLEGAVRAQARRAAGEGIGKDAQEQVALLAITTAGLPTAVAALTWLEGSTVRRRRSPITPPARTAR